MRSRWAATFLTTLALGLSAELGFAASGAGQAEANEEGESTELRMLREMDWELFPPGSPREDLPAPFWEDQLPRIHTTGLPPPPLVEPKAEEVERNLSWLRDLRMPDMPARWNARVIRYLEYYRDTPRGRTVAALAIRRSGRFGHLMRKTLRAHGVPEDLVWASMIESAFNPTARSHAGALGLWQFMPGTARIYGLTVNADIDERLDPELSTLAAARHLSDLNRRFESWELSLAAYNMGYGGLLAAIRKFNTNDYFELSRWESGIPWETTLYVPKIIAMTIVANNPEAFGLEGVEPDPPILFDKVPIPGGTTLKAIAQAAGVAESEIKELNPQFRKGRTPPSAKGESSTWMVKVPLGQGPLVARKFIPNIAKGESIERHEVRFGESLEVIADSWNVSKERILELNQLGDGETIAAKDVLLIPAGEAPAKPSASKREEVDEDDKPVVVIPPMPFEAEGHRRVFYRVVRGEGLIEIAEAFGVKPDDLRRWNALDPGARLHNGMSLQLFVPQDADLSTVVCLEDDEARALTLGSEEFYAFFEGLRGRKRAKIVVQKGDTWQKLGKKYGLSLGQLERINRRSRRSALAPGDTIVVYAPLEQNIPSAHLAEDEESEAKLAPEPLPALNPPDSEASPEPSEGEPPLAKSEVAGD